jgi:hypothetical protein
MSKDILYLVLHDCHGLLRIVISCPFPFQLQGDQLVQESGLFIILLLVTNVNGVKLIVSPSLLTLCYFEN